MLELPSKQSLTGLKRITRNFDMYTKAIDAALEFGQSVRLTNDNEMIEFHVMDEPGGESQYKLILSNKDLKVLVSVLKEIENLNK